MGEHREDPGLAEKPFAHRRTRIGLEQHHLDRDGAVEFAVARLQHAAHPAGGDLRAELVVFHALGAGRGIW